MRLYLKIKFIFVVFWTSLMSSVCPVSRLEDHSSGQCDGEVHHGEGQCTDEDLRREQTQQRGPQDRRREAAGHPQRLHILQQRLQQTGSLLRQVRAGRTLSLFFFLISDENIIVTRKLNFRLFSWTRLCIDLKMTINDRLLLLVSIGSKYLFRSYLDAYFYLRTLLCP